MQKKKMIIKIKKGNGTMISANKKLEEQNLKKKTQVNLNEYAKYTSQVMKP
jgi:ATP-dependent 26S proteasome regulatory subunit